MYPLHIILNNLDIVCNKTRRLVSKCILENVDEYIIHKYTIALTSESLYFVVKSCHLL